MATKLRVDIISDIVCPWCYIGWARFKEGARPLEAEVELDVHWLPFELNPDMPEGGMDRREYLSRKFGPDRLQAIHDRITAAAHEAGVPIALERIERSPSTLAAHRLLMLAHGQGQGQATALQERLFADYFVHGRDIGSPEILADAAESVGLPRDQVLAWLAGQEGRDEVRALERDAHQLGVQGVPFFILERRIALSGAQPPDLVADALRRAMAEQAETGLPPA
jgi:predicted DsbA family dithiol-disulfide isomerase